MKKQMAKNAQVKGRLVAKGFKEEESPQLDSPTMLRESLLLYFAVAGVKDLNLEELISGLHFCKLRD